jgi:hypothetical protein
MRPELRVLRRVAMLPAGEKVPVGAIARELKLTQAAVLCRLQKLVDTGLLDARTLRPPVTGETLAKELAHHCKLHGLSSARVGLHLFHARNGIGRLRVTYQPRPETIAKIRAFLASPPSDDVRVQPSGGPRVADNGGITGAELADQVEAVIAEHNLSKRKVGELIYSNGHGVDLLRGAGRPHKATIEKVRAFLANPPIEDLKKRNPWTGRRATAAAREGGAAGCNTPAAPKPAKRGLSFEEQLALVASGKATITNVVRIPMRASPEQTLGGVATGMLS